MRLGNITKTAQIQHQKQENLQQIAAIDAIKIAILGIKNIDYSKVFIEESHLFQNPIDTIPERFSFIIYNLLRNSLDHIKDNPESIIKIGAEEKIHQNKKYLALYIHDNGSGIRPEDIKNLFSDSKRDLGLAFCKRNMEIFEGDITCESEYEKWTKFSLLFPFKERVKRVLVLDDEQVNLIIAKAKIEKNLKNITCITVNTPEKALSMLSKEKHGFDFVLSDFEMQNINGYQFSKKVRQNNPDLPVVIHSSRQHREFSKLDFKNAPFNQYLRKDVNMPILCRTIAKWLRIEDSMDYLGDKKEYSKHLKNKTILIANIDESNRKAIKKKITNHKAKIIEINNDDSLVKAYNDNMDAIIVDIDTRKADYCKAIREIRDIEIQNGIHHSERIPIIGIAQDRNGSNIKKHLDCKMTDYHIKQDDPELVIKLIANYLNNL